MKNIIRILIAVSMFVILLSGCEKKESTKSEPTNKRKE